MDEQKGQPGGVSKTYVYTAVAVVVLALAAWGLYAYNHRGGGQQAAPQQSLSNIASSTAPAPSSTAMPKKLSYGAAVNAYPFRFQFSQCHGNPGTMAVKVGTVVMLDNRDAVAHTFKADNQTFKIAGYDYALLHTSAISNTNITCDGGGAARLNVEK